MVLIGYTLHWGYDCLLEMDLTEFIEFHEMASQVHDSK